MASAWRNYGSCALSYGSRGRLTEAIDQKHPVRSATGMASAPRFVAFISTVSRREFANHAGFPRNHVWYAVFEQPEKLDRLRLILHLALDESGNAQPLRFPPFHQELLTQDWWNAGEDLGRIRIIISEGLAHADVTSPPFERLNNIISFSFQHAPMGW